MILCRMGPMIPVGYGQRWAVPRYCTAVLFRYRYRYRRYFSKIVPVPVPRYYFLVNFSRYRYFRSVNLTRAFSFLNYSRYSVKIVNA